VSPSLLDLLRRAGRQAAGESGPGAADKITWEVVDEALPNGRYLVLGRELPTTGEVRGLRKGAKVPVAWVRGVPTAILGHQWRRAQFHPPPVDIGGEFQTVWVGSQSPQATDGGDKPNTLLLVTSPTQGPFAVDLTKDFGVPRWDDITRSPIGASVQAKFVQGDPSQIVVIWGSAPGFPISQAGPLSINMLQLKIPRAPTSSRLPKADDAAITLQVPDPNDNPLAPVVCFKLQVTKAAQSSVRCDEIILRTVSLDLTATGPPLKHFTGTVRYGIRVAPTDIFPVLDQQGELHVLALFADSFYPPDFSAQSSGFWAPTRRTEDPPFTDTTFPVQGAPAASHQSEEQIDDMILSDGASGTIKPQCFTTFFNIYSLPSHIETSPLVENSVWGNIFRFPHIYVVDLTTKSVLYRSVQAATTVAWTVPSATPSLYNSDFTAPSNPYLSEPWVSEWNSLVTPAFNPPNPTSTSVFQMTLPYAILYGQGQGYLAGDDPAAAPRLILPMRKPGQSALTLFELDVATGLWTELPGAFALSLPPGTKYDKYLPLVGTRWIVGRTAVAPDTYSLVDRDEKTATPLSLEDLQALTGLTTVSANLEFVVAFLPSDHRLQFTNGDDPAKQRLLTLIVRDGSVRAAFSRFVPSPKRTPYPVVLQHASGLISQTMGNSVFFPRSEETREMPR